MLSALKSRVSTLLYLRALRLQLLFYVLDSILY